MARWRRGCRSWSAMGRSWELELTVDACGWSPPSVRMRRVSAEPAHPHLVIGAGPVTVYALNARAVTDLASAWAAAHVRGSAVLPSTAPLRGAGRFGNAFPAAQVVLDGRQPWNVAAPGVGQPFLVVTAGALTVRVHDRGALDSQLQVWTEASAVGARVFGLPLPPFRDLVARAEMMFYRDADREPGRAGRGRSAGRDGR